MQVYDRDMAVKMAVVLRGLVAAHSTFEPSWEPDRQRIADTEKSIGLILDQLNDTIISNSGLR